MAADRWTARLGLREGRLVLRWGGERQPHAVRGIYRLRAPRAVPRLCGASAELCIGSSRDLAATAATIAAEQHSTSAQLRAALAGAAFWDDTPLERRLLELRLDTATDPLLSATSRRARFLAAHGEPPPVRTGGCSTLPELMLVRLAEGLAAQLRSLRGFTDRSLLTTAPHAHTGMATVDVCYRGACAFRLCRTDDDAPPPPTWPDAVPFRPAHAYLMVLRELGPWSHAPVSTGKAWTALLEPTSRWLVLDQPLPLPQQPAVFDQPGIWAEGVLAQGARRLAARANLSPALRAAWGHLAQQLTAPG